MASVAEGSKGDQSLFLIRAIDQQSVDDFESFLTKERQKPDGSGLNIFVGMVEKLTDRGNGFFSDGF